jgi:prolipoprotein diacylglyceryltransferase
LYEFAAYAAVFAFLWAIRTRTQPPGTLFWWYLVLAPAARFGIEFVRINPPVAFDLSLAQLMSLVMVAVGAWRLVASGALRLRRTSAQRSEGR